MRFLKTIGSGLLVLVAVSAASHFVLDNAISPKNAGLAGAITMFVVWWMTGVEGR